jgi:hypothetical protein
MDHHRDSHEDAKPTPQDPSEYATESGRGNPGADRADIAAEVPPAQATSLEDAGDDEA